MVLDTVQIDETPLTKRKYNRGRIIEPKWIFGGIDPATGECFVQFVQDRSKATLHPLIERFIKPGTEIHSDEWRSYLSIPRLNVQPRFHHGTVNHSRNFVDPETGVHTNNIENLWILMCSHFVFMMFCVLILFY